MTRKKLTPEQVAENLRRKEIRQYEATLRDEQWECLAFGHQWPRLKRRMATARKLPRGFRIAKLATGWQLVEVCLNNCGKERVSTSQPGGRLVRSYPTDSQKWKVRPAGMVASRSEFYTDLVAEFVEVIEP